MTKERERKTFQVTRHSAGKIFRENMRQRDMGYEGATVWIQYSEKTREREIKRERETEQERERDDDGAE